MSEEVKPISEEDFSKKLLNNFHQYINKDVIEEEDLEEESKSPSRGAQKNF